MQLFASYMFLCIIDSVAFIQIATLYFPVNPTPGRPRSLQTRESCSLALQTA